MYESDLHPIFRDDRTMAVDVKMTDFGEIWVV